MATQTSEAPIIVVLCATGSQGSSVVANLMKHTNYRIRAQTRDKMNDASKEMMRKYNTTKRLEMVTANVTNENQLKEIFHGAYGVFCVTPFYDEHVMYHEFEVGSLIARVAKERGVRHFVWSTLPNVETISGGRFKVPHFTDKARVDPVIESLKFEHYTYTSAPFYLENIWKHLKPESRGDTEMYCLPLPGDKRCLNVGDIEDYGKMVAAAFKFPEKYGRGERLYMSADKVSFNELFNTITQTIGRKFAFEQVTDEKWDAFKYKYGQDWKNMFHYIVEFGYFGPNTDRFVENGNKAITSLGERTTTIKEWATKRQDRLKSL